MQKPIRIALTAGALFGLLVGLGIGHWWGKGAAISAKSGIVLTPHGLSDSGARPTGETGTPAGKQEPATKRRDWQVWLISARVLIDQADAISYDSDGFLLRALHALPPERLPGFADELRALGADGGSKLFALTEVLRLWADEDPQAALAWAAALPPPSRDEDQRSPAMMTVLERMSETDAAAAFRALRQQPGFIDAVSEKIFGNWAAQDLHAALAALSEVPESRRGDCARHVYRCWMQQDPRAALIASAGLPDGKDKDFVKKWALDLWGTQDPAAAIAWFSTLPAVEQRPGDYDTHEAMRKTLSRLAEKDPGKAISLLAGLPPVFRSDAIPEIVGSWGLKDLDAAWAWVMELASPKDQLMAMQSLADGAAKADAAKIVQLAGQFPDATSRELFLKRCFGSDPDAQKLQSVLLSLPAAEARAMLHSVDSKNHRKPEILDALAASAPLQAAQMLNALGRPADDPSWSVVASRYAEKDPAAAYAWATTLPGDHAEMLGNIADKLAETDAAGAFARARLLPSGEATAGVITSILATWNKTDPDGLESAAAAMSGGERTIAMDQILSRKIDADPATAASYLLSLQRGGRPEDLAAASSDGTLRGLGSAWAAKNPAQATAWISQLAAGDMQTHYITGVAEKWTESDPMAASRWISTLPAGPGKDAAASHLVEAVSSVDPEGALAWAAQIQEPARREESCKLALEAFIAKDPAAALRALQTAPISAEKKEEMLTRATGAVAK